MKTMKKDITAEKGSGKVYTPDYIVSNILGLSGYYGSKILGKHVIDNSCGDGAFLCQIVNRYCEEAIKKKREISRLREELETYIHGIEINEEECQKCVHNISAVAERFGVKDVKWDVLCGDTTKINQYDGKMDFVLGNPPYVRVHNLGETFGEIKTFSFAQSGMTDLFIVFYELGIKMLNDNGVLGYITPSSYFNSLAGAYMRNYFVNNNLLKAVVDLRHFQAFSATTYTAITILQKGREENSTEYYRFDEKNRIPYYVETLTSDEYQLGGNYYFAPKKEMTLIHDVLTNTTSCDVQVRNGYATLCDDVFIGDFDFTSKHIIPVIKASKGLERTAFFPYDEKGVIIPEEDLKKDNHLYKYLLENKDKLLKRSNDKGETYWYVYGRSQAVGDTHKDKLAINSLLRGVADFKFVEAPAGTGVYGGLYVISSTVPVEKIKAALLTEEFMAFVAVLGKYKSGGYYTFSSKDVKTFLDYKLS